MSISGIYVDAAWPERHPKGGEVGSGVSLDVGSPYLDDDLSPIVQVPIWTWAIVAAAIGIFYAA